MPQFPLPDHTRPARILIVDDERHIRSPLAHALRLSRYVVDEAEDGEQALSKLETATYDVMLLDLRMPGLYGVDVMRRAHRMCPDLLILILTAHATLESALAAVKSEAVDYLLKPVSVHQVIDTVARVLHDRSYQQRQRLLLQTISRATDELRQTEPHRGGQQHFDASWDHLLQRPPLLLDIRQQRVQIESREGTRSAELTKNETAILAALMRSGDTVFSCQQLMLQALGFASDPTTAQNAVRPIIFRLRQKIEDNPKRPKLLQTVRGSGYFLSLPTP
jgi:DNA-binding response OmpR family regulator